MKARPGRGGGTTADYWPAYPGPQGEEVEQEERDSRDVLPPVMKTFQSTRDPHHQHHHHHQPPHPPPSQHPEVRRTPSFVEKIREAEANPGVRFVRRIEMRN